ncbi:hypothetical protein OBBRIDRAFT_804336 [Obba rivulosa]|uniref:Uncharacterized protein n=1 Tax=Obba rivulosa TaxID=1052685 RepID=A0A8E2AVD7_9APHY|nr:hypothetical protein OBBRIDRAFT_804336 [Obba rivulosa]
MTQKAQKTAPQPSNTMNTRARNKTWSPAAPDMPRPKRTPQMMQILRKKQAAAEIQEESQMRGNIGNVAEIEAAMVRADCEAAWHADHPLSTASEEARRQSRRAKMVAEASPPVEEDNDDLEDGGPEEPGVVFEPPLDGESSDNSQDEYDPESDVGEDELDSGEDEVEDDEDVDQPPTRKVKTGKPKYGRADVIVTRKSKEGARAAVVGTRKSKEGAPLTVVGKHQPSKKAKLPSKPGGLPVDWKDRLQQRTAKGAALPVPTHPPRSASTGSLSSMAPPTSDTDANAFTDEDGIRYGGLEDEDESAEQAAQPKDEDESAEQAAQPKERSTITNLTVIRPGVAYAKPSRTARQDGKNGRVRWTTAHIPEDQREEFTKSFIPLARELAGTRGPWDALTAPNVQITEKDVFHTLANYRVSDWRSMFGSIALEGVKKLIEDNQETGIIRGSDDISYAMKHLLGDGKTRIPFCWKHFDDERKSGRFQHFLISYTLSAHFNTLFAIPDHFKKSHEFPKGALILSVLAVERALNVWRSGMLVIPPKSAGHFSEQNWGDRVEHHDGRAVMNRKTSKFIPVVDKLQNNDWQKILDAAHECYRDRTKKSAEEAVVPAPGSDEEFDMVSDPE